MDKAAFENSPSGRLVSTIEGAWAFVPHPLPPVGLDLTALLGPISKASQALGELNGIGRTMPNPYLLIRPLQRREAVSSSSMEGTHSSLSDLLLLEAGAESEQPLDTREVYNHVRALEHGMSRMAELPIAQRLLCEMHEKLLEGVARHRGAAVQAGTIKREQNWIGGSGRITDARFVPPPPNVSVDVLSNLEKYIHRAERDEFPAVLDAALIHYQFETLHPFADGNGRIGRMLITLMLADRGALAQPLLYMSPYLEREKDRYIDLMLEVSKTANWIPWIRFFLEAVVSSSTDAVAVVRRLQDLQGAYRERFQKAQRSALLLRIIDLAFERPALSITELSSIRSVTYQGALNNVNILLRTGVAKDVKRRGQNVYPRVIIFPEIVQALSSV